MKTVQFLYHHPVYIRLDLLSRHAVKDCFSVNYLTDKTYNNDDIFALLQLLVITESIVIRQVILATNPAVGCLYFPPARVYLPSRRPSPPLGQYQIIVLGDKGTIGVNNVIIQVINYPSRNLCIIL